MRARDAVGVAGALVAFVGAVVAVSPSVATGTPLAPVADAVAAVGAYPLMLAGGALVALSLVGSALVPSAERRLSDDGASERFERLVSRPPEAVVDGAPRTAAAFDATVERAVAGDEQSLERVRERLAGLTVAALDGRVDDQTTGTDDRRVATGTWTDDRTAAAFLAGPEGPSQTLAARIRHWLAPERERRRRIRRTVAAIQNPADRRNPGGTSGTGDGHRPHGGGG